MKQYYYTKYNFYSSYLQGATTYERNGFDEYPMQAYSMFVEAINSLPENLLRIIDVGCGNGLLLKHIMQNSFKRIEPNGIDFLQSSILEAQNTILPQFSDNFICINAIDYVFSRYDVVLYDPSIFAEEDRDVLFQRIKKSRSKYCILYVYADVLTKYGNPYILNLVPSAILNNVRFKMRTEQMSLALLEMNNG